jgi:hypothetical protein
MLWLGLGIGLLIGVVAGATGLALYAVKADRRKAL